MAKTRADQLLVAAGLAETRSRARALIMAGTVLDGAGQPVAKPGGMYEPGEAFTLKESKRNYASRGGDKLDGALKDLGLDIVGVRAIDVGASTGGFTDRLLQGGAESVTAVDVGYGQLDWRLRNDPRVRVLERTNARHLAPGELGETFGLAVIDVSFISLTLILGPVAALIEPGGHVLALVKPQFEAGREHVAKGGVVREEAARLAAVDKVAHCAAGLGLAELGRTPSRLKGPKGNQEYFLLLAKPAPPAGV